MTKNISLLTTGLLIATAFLGLLAVDGASAHDCDDGYVDCGPCVGGGTETHTHRQSGIAYCSSKPCGSGGDVHPSLDKLLANLPC